jgi:addiction module RelE/StbE family toxin
MRIEWSQVALADIEDLYDYIARDVPFYAEQFVGRVMESVERLAEHPRLGRRVPEAQDRDDIRELTFHDYRILYLVHAEGVFILTVIHGSRDLGGRTVKPWEEG